MTDKHQTIPFNTLTPLFKKHSKEYEETALRVLRSGWYIMGPELEAFEAEFGEYVGSGNCIGVNSGLDALTLALKALGVEPGDEVIVQANTYIATVLAITANNATPVFVEPDEYHGLDPQMLGKAITKRTKAIMAVHLYGQPCDMRSISEITNQAGIPLIEDCAQSHGATFAGKMTGTFGVMGCFSFYPTKNLGAFGDAGAVVTDDKILAERIRVLRNYGSKIKYQNEIEGVNSRLDEIQAALLRVRLNHLEEILTEREAIAKQYLEGIINPLVKLPKVRPDSRHTWHQFVIKCNQRDKLQKWLKKSGIQTQIHYPIPPYLSKAYESLSLKKGSYPKTEDFSNTILSLPLFNSILEIDLDRIIASVNQFFVK